MTRRGVLALGALGLVSACSDSSEPSGGPSSPGLSPTSSASTSGGPASWKQLRRHVSGTLALPGDPSYPQVKLVENPRYDDNRPLAVLSVASAADVATAFAFAQDNDVPISIRSGGHSYPGWSAGGAPGTGTPPALVIDCRQLNGVQIQAAETVLIGSGAALAPVYYALGRAGRAVAGGSCATVAVGGLTLGGGVGVLTRAMGLTCDAVSAMEVVTADGKTLTVNADEHSDLFWALRGGGGGHLGVVISFQMQTHLAPTLNTFYLTWPMSAAARVIEAWQGWAPEADARLWSTLKGLGGASHTSGPVLLLSGTWIGPGSALDSQLAGLLDHVPPPSSRSTAIRTYEEAMASYAGCSSIPVAQCNTGPGGKLTRTAFGATSSIAYDPLSSAGISTLLDQVEQAQSSGLLEAGISMDALGGKVRDLDPDATAFVHRKALWTVQYTATFDHSDGTAKAADDYVRGFRSAMAPHWGQWAYVNYADSSISDYQDAYFGANAQRLAEARATYDPHGFFSQPQDF